MDLEKAVSIIKTEANNIKKENNELDEETINGYLKEIELRLANVEIYKLEMLELADRRRDVRRIVRGEIDTCFVYLISAWKYLENFVGYEKFVFCLEEEYRIETLRRSIYNY